MTHQEIAHELQVSRTAITSDIQYLRSQAKESIKEYVTEHLPEQPDMSYSVRHYNQACI
jgi:DNA-directed RNA polymerase specialized sigma24 family protein